MVADTVGGTTGMSHHGPTLGQVGVPGAPRHQERGGDAERGAGEPEHRGDDQHRRLVALGEEAPAPTDMRAIAGAP